MGTLDMGALAEEAPLAARVGGFVDHLRMNDFAIGLPEGEAALKLMGAMPLDDAAAVRRALKILLTGRHEEWLRFDDLFEAYWFARGRARQAPGGVDDTRGSSAASRRLWSAHTGPAAKDAAEHEEGEGDIEVDAGMQGRLIASGREVHMRTDFRQFADAEEIAEAERLAYRLARAIRYRISRRHRPSKRGQRLDMRRIIRKSLATGGEPVTLHRREPPDRPVRLVVFLDVSGSMKPYSRFFLQFVKGLVCTWLQADAYLVHTRLIRVTDAVRERDSVKAMTRLALMADGFGGGTKLGESLKAFNDLYARRALNSRSVAVILSDGYDTGAPEGLAAELARLKKRCPRLVWLNPLLGWKDYEPVTAAMTAALPHIDHFAAANTPRALAALEPHLARL